MAEQTRAVARREQQAPSAVVRDAGATRGNLVAVTEDIRRLNPYYMYRRAEVLLSPNPDDGDVYSASFLGKAKGSSDSEANNFALAKNGVLKLARAAGISTVTEECRPLVFDRDRIVYESVVSWRGPDGSIRKAKGSVEIDLHPDSACMAELREECKTVISGWGKTKSGKSFPEKRKATPEEEETKFRAEVSRLKKFMLPVAETKSLLRAIRALLQLKQKYSPAEIAQPFFVEVLEYAPDLTDEAVRNQVLQQGAAASAALYGTAPAQPALPAPASPTPAPDAQAEAEVVETWDAPPDDEEGRSEADELWDAEDQEPQTVEGAPAEHPLDNSVCEWIEGMNQAPNLNVLEKIYKAAREKKPELTPEHIERLKDGYSANKTRLDREARETQAK